MENQNKLPDSLQKLVDEFIGSMSAKEHKAYLIAQSHLGLSFQIEKSIGFIKWKRDKISTIST